LNNVLENTEEAHRENLKETTVNLLSSAFRKDYASLMEVIRGIK